MSKEFIISGSFKFLQYFNYTLEQTFEFFEYIANYIHHQSAFDHLETIYNCFKQEKVRNLSELIPFILSKAYSEPFIQTHNINKSTYSLFKHWLFLICPRNKNLIQITKELTDLTSFTKRLATIGIVDTFSLLERCKTQKGRQEFREDHDLDLQKLETLVQLADIGRIHSRDAWVRGLVKLGYSTCYELAKEDEERLLKKLLKGKHIPNEKYSLYITRSYYFIWRGRKLCLEYPIEYYTKLTPILATEPLTKEPLKPISCNSTKSNTKLVKYIKMFHFKPHHLGLTSDQKKYYCYWKNQLNRKKKTMDTTYSYILLYCYEVINDLILSNSLERFNALVYLFEAYVIKFQVLKERIMEWTVEYGLQNRIPHNIVSSFVEQNLTHLDLETNKNYSRNITNILLTSLIKEPIKTIDFNHIFKCLSSRILKSATRLIPKEEFILLIKILCVKIDVQCQQSQSKTFFEQFSFKALSKRPFTFARINSRDQLNPSFEVFDFFDTKSGSKNFRKSFESICIYVINKYRDLYHKPLLMQDYLPIFIKKTVDSYFETVIYRKNKDLHQLSQLERHIKPLVEFLRSFDINDYTSTLEFIGDYEKHVKNKGNRSFRYHVLQEKSLINYLNWRNNVEQKPIKLDIVFSIMAYIFFFQTKVFKKTIDKSLLTTFEEELSLFEYNLSQFHHKSVKLADIHKENLSIFGNERTQIQDVTLDKLQNRNKSQNFTAPDYLCYFAFCWLFLFFSPKTNFKSTHLFFTVLKSTREREQEYEQYFTINPIPQIPTEDIYPINNILFPNFYTFRVTDLPVLCLTTGYGSQSYIIQKELNSIVNRLEKADYSTIMDIYWKLEDQKKFSNLYKEINVSKKYLHALQSEIKKIIPRETNLSSLVKNLSSLAKVLAQEMRDNLGLKTNCQLLIASQTSGQRKILADKLQISEKHLLSIIKGVDLSRFMTPSTITSFLKIQLDTPQKILTFKDPISFTNFVKQNGISRGVYTCIHYFMGALIALKGFRVIYDSSDTQFAHFTRYSMEIEETVIFYREKNNKLNSENLSYDSTRVDKLIDDSNNIESKLVSYLDSYNEEDMKKQIPVIISNKTDLTSENEFQAFIQSLSGGQKDVLIIILKNFVDMDEKNLEMLKRVAKKENKMIKVLIDELNDIAIEITGDIIIDSDYKIIDEYYDELEASLVDLGKRSKAIND